MTFDNDPNTFWSIFLALCSDGYDICVHMINFQVLFRNYLELLRSLSLSLSINLFLFLNNSVNLFPSSLHHYPIFRLYHTQKPLYRPNSPQLGAETISADLTPILSSSVSVCSRDTGFYSNANETER